MCVVQEEDHRPPHHERNIDALSWDSRGPDLRIDRWEEQGGELGDPAEVLDAVTLDVKQRIWHSAAHVRS